MIWVDISVPAINVPPMFDSTLPTEQAPAWGHEIPTLIIGTKVELVFSNYPFKFISIKSSASVTFFWLVAEKIISASKKLKAKWLLAQPIFCAHGGVGSSNTSSGTKMSQENEDK